MGTFSATVRARVLAGVCVAGFALALLAPAVAFAANTATFTSRTPAAGARVTSARPAVSVRVYDRYGVKGSGTSWMWIDGKSVTPRRVYTTRGRYTRFTLSYNLKADLPLGAHTLKVKVRDLKRRTSTIAWSFTVIAAPLPPMPVSGTKCVDCHAGYPASHPMDRCPACHGASSPARVGGGSMNPYSAADRSAHALSCAVSRCHRGGGAFPHVFDSDCGRCHSLTVSYPGIPSGHSLDVEAVHQAPARFCIQSGCHAASLTVEHYRRTKDGARLTCATCHGSTDPDVRAAIDDRSTACEACHGEDGHAAEHGITRSDRCAGCHAGTQLVAVHTESTCSVCHSSTDAAVKNAVAAGEATCDDCHASLDHGPVHDVVRDDTCSAPECHGAGDTNLTTIHDSCSTCHKSTDPAVVSAIAGHRKACASCHGATPTNHQSHLVSPADAAMRISGVDFGSHACGECHRSLELMDLHGRACRACHPTPATGRAIDGRCVQGECHKVGTTRAQHATISSAHALGSTPSCVATDCHVGGTNVASIHRSEGCVTCHGAGKRLTLVCATVGCHGGSDAHPAALPHPKMTAGHTAGLPATCVKAGCHVADLPALHARGPKCAPCHGVAGVGGRLTKECSAAGCHPYLVDSTTLHPTYVSGHMAGTAGCTAGGCHKADVLALHTTGTTGTPPGCAACHAAGKPELTLACATVGCHVTRPPSHESHPVTPPDAVISISGASLGSHACSECHTPLDLIDLHGDACTACHPQPAAGLTINGGCVQGECHKVGTPLAMHGSIDTSHTLGAAPSCVATECHSGGTNVAAIHKTHGGCAACHDGVRVDEPTIVCATSGCHGASDGHPATLPHPRMTPGHTTGLSISCVKAGCHAADLVALHAPGPACAPCHGVDGEGGTLTKDCANAACHPYAVSSTTLHPTYASGHTAGGTGCTATGCHDSDVIALHTTGTTGTPPGCAACHASGRPRLTLACATVGCHETTPIEHESHPVSPTEAAITISGSDFGSHACSECHAPLDLIGLHPSGCATCHPSPATALVVDGGCVQGGCHKAGTPLAQHGSIDESHTLGAAPSCVATDCHTGGTNVAAIHKKHGGCAACHDGMRVAQPTLACDTDGCHGRRDKHSLTSPHPGMATAHGTGLPATCVKAGCHAADLVALHAPGPRCAPCHGVGGEGGTLTGDCSTQGCHPFEVDSLTLHPSYASGHMAEVDGCTAVGCHAANAIALHTTGTTGTPPGCAACHAAGKPGLTLACATVGCHDVMPVAHSSHPVDPSAAPVSISGTDFGSHACGECHRPLDLIDLHDGACAACHPSPATGVAINGGCVQGGCHRFDTPLAQHTSIDASHALEAEPSCIGADCHDGGTNIAAIHETRGGCAACHDGERVARPTIECATIGCHSDSDGHPASIPHPKMTAGHTGLSVTCVKTGCHVGDAVSIHGRTRCAACHDNADHALSKDCTACHAGMSLTTHVDVHNDCIVCHSKLNTWHPYYQYIPRITATSTCSSCHIGSAGGSSSHLSGGFQHNFVRFNGNPNLLCVMNCHGNQDAPSYQFHLNYQPFDKIAPSTTAPYETSYIGAATIRLSATDTGEYNPKGSGVAHTYFMLDTAGWQQGTTVTVEPPVAGVAGHRLRYYSDDLCGNSETEHEIFFTVEAP